MMKDLRTKQEGFNHFQESIFVTALMLTLIAAIHLLKTYNLVNTTEWGIYPREAWGMRGVLLSPLVHGSAKHLFSNAAPLIVTLFVLHFFYRKVAVRSLIMIWFFTGVMVWFLAGRAWHIGASGVVYGLVSFIFWTGVFRKNKKSIVLALIMLILYSGMFQGILPNEPGVSWESHLYGSLVGIYAAWWFKAEIEDDELERPIVFEHAEKQYFLSRDTFEKTLAQRKAEEEERLRQSLLDQGFPPFYYTIREN
jgi:membrane associated rhomboid family serine protease